jgi:Gas vesicle protein
VACLQFRAGNDRSGVVTESRALYASPRTRWSGRTREVTLLDLLDRLLAGGIVIQAHVTLAAAEIDLVDLDLAVLVASVDTAVDR